MIKFMAHQLFVNLFRFMLLYFREKLSFFTSIRVYGTLCRPKRHSGPIVTPILLT